MNIKNLQPYKHYPDLYYDSESDVFVKYWYERYNFEKWWSVYQDYQNYEPRAVQILDVNFKKRYYLMESIHGVNLEHEMIALGFNDSKKILIDTMDIFNNFFKFKSKNLHETEIFFHKDFRTENLIFDKNNTVRLVDPDSFSNVPLDRMNNLLFFGRYMDTLTSIRERLSFSDLTEEQKYNLGKGYLY